MSTRRSVDYLYYEQCDHIDISQDGHIARVLVADKHNQTKDFLVQTIILSEDKKSLTSHFFPKSIY